jgi:asparagine synthase (glutamine-hydrolysing)
LPWVSSSFGQLREIGARSRVALSGFGADPALSSRLTVHFRQLLKKKEYSRALADAARYLAAERRVSRLYIATRWRLWFKAKGERAWFPAWLNEDFEKRLGLRERWKVFDGDKINNGAVRPGAYQLVVAPLWTNLFEAHDPGVTRVPLEVRHPFFDLHLLDFLLGLPALPWCSDKELLRQAGRGILPEAVRLRPKSPLIVDPLIALLQKQESARVDEFVAAPELGQYVLPSLIPRVMGETDVWRAWVNLRPLSLNKWLRAQVSRNKG